MDLITFNKKHNKNRSEDFFNDLFQLVKDTRIKECHALLKLQTIHDENCDCVKTKFILNKIKELEKQ